LDIGVLGYIGIVQHKEHSPEVLSIPLGTPCIYILCTGCYRRSLPYVGTAFVGLVYVDINKTYRYPK